MDIEQGAQTIAEGLGLGIEPVEDPPEDLDPQVNAPAEAPAETPAFRTAPKSWAKEYHEPWAKVDPKVQEYIEQREKQMLDGLSQYKEHNDFGKQMREVFTPYRELLQQQGVDEIKAAQYLINAHARLMTLPAGEKAAYLQSIARNYGVEMGQPNDALSAVQQQINNLTQVLTTQQQREFDQVKTRVQNDVTTFADAKDEKGSPLHPYFDEVAPDIVAMIHAGKSLEDAYKSAVWSNPVTREKELARIRTDAEVNLRSKSKQEAEKALRASSANVRSRDTRAAPTEPLGKMDDTLKSTLAEIKARAAH